MDGRKLLIIDLIDFDLKAHLFFDWVWILKIISIVQTK